MKKSKTNIESGLFLDKIPYLKQWSDKSTKKLVVFPHTAELIQSLITNPEEQATLFRKYIPEEYILYILGYDRNLSSDHTSNQIADDFAQIIREHIGIPDVVMAVSYGGFTGIPFAARYPELIKEKLILMVIAHCASESGKKLAKEMVKLAKNGDIYTMDQMFNDLFTKIFFKWIVKFLTRLRKNVINPDLNPISTLINGYTHMIQTSNERKKYLSQIKASTLVIGGNQDKFFSEELYRETAGLIPNGRVKIFNAGHMVPVEKMRKVKKAIYQFLRE